MENLNWWQKAVFYQIYPSSFADHDGDGIGDFPGITSKLDYIQDLGVDAIWLSPHFPSPQKDCGYDISDYLSVAPEYGTMRDFKDFLKEAHRRDMRVILDLVLNHTSDAHPWFIESRSSLDNPKRDWYIWREGKNGGPPNNWCATFGGSAWEFDSKTGQYYYHFFLKEQPDLNWHNPEVKQAMWDVVRFWLDIGVDGYRLDAIGTIFEDSKLPNHKSKISLEELTHMMSEASNPKAWREIATKRRKLFESQVEQPGVHTLMQELRELVDSYDDRLLVGESHLLSYCGDGENELHLVFNFPLMQTDELNPDWIRANQKKRLTALESISPHTWPCNTLNNHDTSRLYSRYCQGKNGDQQARLAASLLLTLPGTPFLYYGEEIGMTDLQLDDISQFRDLWGVWIYEMEINTLGNDSKKALEVAAQISRDKCRTPMQWSSLPNAGFSPESIQTWLPFNPDYAKGINVADQLLDANSLFNFYKSLISLRKQTPALISGSYTPIREDSEEYLAFLRETESQTCLVVLNYSDKTHKLKITNHKLIANTLFSNHKRGEEIDDLLELTIHPYEVYIAELAGDIP